MLVRVFAITLAFMVFLPFPASAIGGTIKHAYEEGTVTLTVDPARIDPEIVRKFLVIHPVAYDPTYRFAPSLRLCHENDPRYHDCGKRNLMSTFFLDNAAVNIDLGIERLNYLADLAELPFLKRLVEHFRNSLAFSLWQNRQLYKYYVSGNTDILREQYRHLVPSPEVTDAVYRLGRARTTEEKWKISFFDWFNATNALYREQEAAIPKDDWDEFLKKYGITERLEIYRID